MIMNYQQLINGSPTVLVEFYASWCPHCQKMMPVVEQVKELLDGTVPVYQFDIDDYPELSRREGADSIPTFIVYSNGKAVWRHSGEMDGNVLLQKVQSFVK